MANVHREHVLSVYDETLSLLEGLHTPQATALKEVARQKHGTCSSGILDSSNIPTLFPVTVT